MVNTNWKFRRKQSVASRAAQWTAFANVLFLLGAAILLQVGILTPYGMFIAVLAVIGFAIVTLALVLIGFASLWRIGAKGGWASLRAMFTTAIILAPFILVVGLARALPPTYDTSSNLTFPPQFPIGSRGAVQSLPFMEGFMKRQVDISDDRRTIETKRYTKDYEIVRDLAIGLSKDWGWTEESRAGDHLNDVRIGYTARTLLFNLPIDVVVQITERENSISVDMRSASRIEAPDLGYNARFIKTYFQALDERILATNIGKPNG